MAPPTAKDKYKALFAKLAEQHRGVESGATSRVSEQQLEQLAQLQDEWAAELGLAASGVPMREVQERLEAVEEREAAVTKREEAVKQHESEYEQQEALLESLKEELEVWRSGRKPEKRASGYRGKN